MAIWLSWSAFDQYRNRCSQQYNWQRVKKLDPPVKDSRHNAIIGVVLQKVYEDFYNQELWRKGAETSSELLARAELYFWEFIETEYIDWKDFTCRFDSPADVLVEIQETVPKILKGIKRETFLGPYAKSEINLKVRFRQSDFLVGYLDFIIRKKDDTVIILDGKASRHREKYIKPDQLHFYALMFYLRYRTLPTKMGFFYYRFADDPEQALDWVKVDPARLKSLKGEIEDVIDDIRDRKFSANPHYSHCQWCLYERICDERQAQKKQNSEKRAKSSKKPRIEADFSKGGKTFIGFDNLKKPKKSDDE